ncbi:MAG: hypothetical protein IJV41_02490 [Oscillospiraceae bacterium]|nr:hypothetical protein [Parasporobacterium sp.]MBQ9685403.1 hypothetical protein [Oscillospiraceae bacterium]
MIILWILFIVVSLVFTLLAAGWLAINIVADVFRHMEMKEEWENSQKRNTGR